MKTSEAHCGKVELVAYIGCEGIPLKEEGGPRITHHEFNSHRMRLLQFCVVGLPSDPCPYSWITSLNNTDGNPTTPL